MADPAPNRQGLLSLPAFLKTFLFDHLFEMRQFDSTPPDFDHVAQAFDNLRRNNSNVSPTGPAHKCDKDMPCARSFRTEDMKKFRAMTAKLASKYDALEGGDLRKYPLPSQSPRMTQEQSDEPARGLIKSLPASKPLVPHEGNATLVSLSSETECPKITYTIRKLTEEEMAADDELQLATYTRGFDAEWTDVEDILTYKCSSKRVVKKIILFMVKGRDFDWVWLPATCVPVRVIEAFFQGGQTSTNDISLPTAAENDDNTLTIWKVRQSTRGHFGLKNVLEIACFAALEEANACAKHHFKLHWVPGTSSPTGKYRFGNRFLGISNINKFWREDIVVWVEKENRKVVVPAIVQPRIDHRKLSIATENPTFNWYNNATSSILFTPNVTADEGITSQGKVESEQMGRVKDGRDLFYKIHSRKHHVEVGPLSGSLPKDESLDPYTYIKNLEKENVVAVEEWKKEWKWRHEFDASVKIHEDMLRKGSDELQMGGFLAPELSVGAVDELREEGYSSEETENGCVIMTPCSSMFADDDYLY